MSSRPPAPRHGGPWRPQGRSRRPGIDGAWPSPTRCWGSWAHSYKFSKNYSWISLLLYYWLLTIVHPIHFAYFYFSYTKNIMKYLGMSRTCPQNVSVLTILGHLQKCPESICPMSFLNLSNLSYVLSQTCLKMCPWPEMSRMRPVRVPGVSSKCPCPDHFGTSPNRTSETKYTTFY